MASHCWQLAGITQDSDSRPSHFKMQNEEVQKINYFALMHKLAQTQEVIALN